MKKGKLLLLCVMLMAAGSYAQKCDFDKDETDAYSKEHYRMVKHNFGNLRKMWVFIMEQKGDQYFVTVNMAEIGDFIRNVAKEGTNLKLKLENNTIVEVPVVADAVPSVQLMGSNINSQWLIKCSVTPDKMKILSENPITGMRINMGDRDFDAPDLKSKQSNKIMGSAKCLLTKG